MPRLAWDSETVPVLEFRGEFVVKIGSPFCPQAYEEFGVNLLELAALRTSPTYF